MENCSLFKQIIVSEEFKNSGYYLPIALGRSLEGETEFVDLRRLPHILISGAGKQGKSALIRGAIGSLLHKKTAHELKLIFINTNDDEPSIYKGLEGSYLINNGIISDAEQAVATINSLCQEMENRMEKIKSIRYARHIEMYNEVSTVKMPYIVCVIDEFSELMIKLGKKFEMPLTRLAEFSYHIGIHLIISTKHSNHTVITDAIRNAFACRISFRQSSRIESYTTLLSPRATLLDTGEMYITKYPDSKRLQGVYLSKEDAEELVKMKQRNNDQQAVYALPACQKIGDDDLSFDPKLKEAAQLVVQRLECYPTAIQYGLSIGYNRTGRILQQLERLGILGEKTLEGRKILVRNEEELENVFNQTIG